METFVKLTITLFFLGLIVAAIVFFSIFGLLPTQKLVDVLKSEPATSTSPAVIVATTTVIERIIERERVVEPVVPPKPPVVDEEIIEGLPPGAAVPISLTRVGNVHKWIFSVSGEGGELSEDLIVVDVLDIIEIHFTAVDGDYGISFPDFGVGKSVSAGEATKFQFQAQFVGNYEISCGGCRPGWEGKFVVREK